MVVVTKQTLLSDKELTQKPDIPEIKKESPIIKTETTTNSNPYTPNEVDKFEVYNTLQKDSGINDPAFLKEVTEMAVVKEEVLLEDIPLQVLSLDVFLIAHRNLEEI